METSTIFIIELALFYLSVTIYCRFREQEWCKILWMVIFCITSFFLSFDLNGLVQYGWWNHLQAILWIISVSFVTMMIQFMCNNEEQLKQDKLYGRICLSFLILLIGSLCIPFFKVTNLWILCPVYIGIFWTAIYLSIISDEDHLLSLCLLIIIFWCLYLEFLLPKRGTWFASVLWCIMNIIILLLWWGSNNKTLSWICKRILIILVILIILAITDTDIPNHWRIGHIRW